MNELNLCRTIHFLLRALLVAVIVMLLICLVEASRGDIGKGLTGVGLSFVGYLILCGLDRISTVHNDLLDRAQTERYQYDDDTDTEDDSSCVTADNPFGDGLPAFNTDPLTCDDETTAALMAEEIPAAAPKRKRAPRKTKVATESAMEAATA